MEKPIGAQEAFDLCMQEIKAWAGVRKTGESIGNVFLGMPRGHLEELNKLLEPEGFVAIDTGRMTYTLKPIL